MPGKKTDKGLFEKRYRVAVGSCGGKHHGEVYEPHELKEVFASEENLLSRIKLGALVEVPEETEDGTLGDTTPQPRMEKDGVEGDPQTDAAAHNASHVAATDTPNANPSASATDGQTAAMSDFLPEKPAVADTGKGKDKS